MEGQMQRIAVTADGIAWNNYSSPRKK